MRQKVLITGGSGLLATNWALTIRDKFSVVLVLHKRIIDIPGIDFDIINLSSVCEINRKFSKHKPDIVVNTAGLTSVEKCEKYPKLAKEINTNIAENIAIVCNELDIKLVHISTDHLFSGKDRMMTEGHNVRPQNIYARTKYYAETKVGNSCKNALIIRTNFYGWGTSYRKSFSDFIISSLIQQKKIILFSDVFYTPILIKTLVHAVHDLVNIDESGTFNIVGSDRISKFEFGKKVADCFSLDKGMIEPGHLRDNLSLVNRPFDMSLSNNKVCKILKREISTVKSDLFLLKNKEMTL